MYTPSFHLIQKLILSRPSRGTSLTYHPFGSANVLHAFPYLNPRPRPSPSPSPSPRPRPLVSGFSTYPVHFPYTLADPQAVANYAVFHLPLPMASHHIDSELDCSWFCEVYEASRKKFKHDLPRPSYYQPLQCSIWISCTCLISLLEVERTKLVTPPSLFHPVPYRSILSRTVWSFPHLNPRPRPSPSPRVRLFHLPEVNQL